MLIYPSTVLIIALFITALLLSIVIPQFELLFKTFGAELPLFTQVVIGLSKFTQAYGLIIGGTTVCVVYSFFYVLKRSQYFHQSIDKLLLKIPCLGIILTKAIIARFARTLSITFAAGLPLLEALKSVAAIADNFVYTRAINRVQEEVNNGQQFQTAIANTALFPAMVIQMITVGEESGTLEQMLAKIADYYEEEVDTAISTFNNLLEPIIMSLLGLLVGGLIIAMYLPIFKLGAVV